MTVMILPPIEKEKKEKALDLINKVREGEITLGEMLMEYIPTLAPSILEGLREVAQNPELAEILAVPVRDAIGRKLFLELQGTDNGSSLYLVFTIKELPELLDFCIAQPEQGTIGLRVKKRPLLKMVEGALNEGRIDLVEHFQKLRIWIYGGEDWVEMSDLVAILMFQVFPRAQELISAKV
jgi:hypothetical protein